MLKGSKDNCKRYQFCLCKMTEDKIDRLVKINSYRYQRQRLRNRCNLLKKEFSNNLNVGQRVHGKFPISLNYLPLLSDIFMI